VRRWAKIALAALAVLAVLVAVNVIVTGAQTERALTTVEGGRILRLPGGDLQVVSDGPVDGSDAGTPIVLLHCFACSLHWWDRVLPMLDRHHRVIRADLLGFGGSEKPKSDYEIDEQGRLLARALGRLHVRKAVVVGHSMGFDVAVALAREAPGRVDRLVNLDEQSSPEYGGLPFLAKLGFVPVVGETLWRTTPDFMVEDGYDPVFAPGYDLGAFDDQVVDDFRAMTYTSYDRSYAELEDYEDARPLADRARNAAVPLLVLFGAEDQLYDDPEATANAYRSVPGASIQMIAGAGHSPNVEKPAETARLILGFAEGTRISDGR
jgi:pimeloyl-ACP methyl ester carboxylesterase